jgi:hypothetical protein
MEHKISYVGEFVDGAQDFLCQRIYRWSTRFLLCVILLTSIKFLRFENLFMDHKISLA